MQRVLEAIAATPLDFARSLVQPPVLSSEDHGWEHVLLHRCQVPSFETRLPGSNVHRVTIHLTGSVLIERTRGDRRDRRWSELDCTNVVPAGVPVSRLFKGYADFLAIHLSPILVSDVAADIFDLDPSRVELVESFAVPGGKLGQLGRLMLAEAEGGAMTTRLYADMIGRLPALHLLRAYSDRSRQAPEPQGVMVGWRLRRAMEYIQAHLEEDFSLAELAGAAGLSPSQFARAFRATTGEPPHRYVIRLRLDRACHLLEHTRLPVIEVGLLCGFKQTAHFASMFRKTIGLSPRAYRTTRCA